MLDAIRKMAVRRIREGEKPSAVIKNYGLWTRRIVAEMIQ
jgi:hypothetical protein